MSTQTYRRSHSAQRQALQAAEALFLPKAAASAPRPYTVPSSTGARTGGCPVCRRPWPIAPERSRHRSAHTVEHDWRCAACDHAWTTTAAIGAPAQGPRFVVGATVRLIVPYGSRRRHPASFVVLASRPSERGGLQYRISSPAESFERYAHETELEHVAPGDSA